MFKTFKKLSKTSKTQTNYFENHQKQFNHI